MLVVGMSVLLVIRELCLNIPTLFSHRMRLSLDIALTRPKITRLTSLKRSRQTGTTKTQNIQFLQHHDNDRLSAFEADIKHLGIVIQEQIVKVFMCLALFFMIDPQFCAEVHRPNMSRSCDGPYGSVNIVHGRHQNVSSSNTWAAEQTTAFVNDRTAWTLALIDICDFPECNLQHRQALACC